MQHLFQLSELQVDAGFLPVIVEARLPLRQPLQQLVENTLGVADVGQRVLAADGLLDHRHQMVGNLRRCREYGGNLSLLRITFQNVSDAKKTFRVRYRGPTEFQHSHVKALLNFCRKKSPHCSGAGFFLFFLYASARTLTGGNGGCNNGDVQAG